MVARAEAAIQRAGTTPPLGVWWDYEDHGVAQWQLTDAFRGTDAAGIWSGYYSNAGTVDHSEFLDREWWLAAYPGDNDGSFPGLERMRPPRDVTIWQFSSTNGRLDVNVIVDEAWYATVTGGQPAPGPVPQKGRSVIYDETRDDGNHTYWQEGLGGLVQLPEHVAAAHIFGGDLLIPCNSLDIISLAVARDSRRALGWTARWNRYRAPRRRRWICRGCVRRSSRPRRRSRLRRLRYRDEAARYAHPG